MNRLFFLLSGFFSLLLLAADASLSKADAEIKLTVYGAAGEVSGACNLIQFDKTRFLVDCGLFYPFGEGDAQQREARSDAANNKRFDFDVNSINALFLTHAHLDHVGRLGHLLDAGYKGTIYCSGATRDLLYAVASNSISMEKTRTRNWYYSVRDRSKESQKYISVHWNPNCKYGKQIAPKNQAQCTGNKAELEKVMKFKKSKFRLCRTCSETEAQDIVSKIQPVEYNKPILVNGVNVTFYPARHIPGSSSILFDNSQKRVLFSGDIGPKASDHLPGTDVAPAADMVIVEGTYGSVTRSDNPADCAENFQKSVGKIAGQGGIALIPSFALDRSQRILEQIRLGKKSGLIPLSCPVYLYSPSAQRYVALYEEHSEDSNWFSEKTLRDSLAYKFSDVIQKKYLLKEFPRPAIIVATSNSLGDSFSGDVYQRIKGDSRSGVFFIGYQAEESEGRQVRDNQFPENKRPACEIYTFNCFSGHADSQEIDRWLSGQSEKTVIVLVHGDAQALSQRRVQRLAIPGTSRKVFVAQPGNSLAL